MMDTKILDKVRIFHPGDKVRHFKFETAPKGSYKYFYRIIAFAKHTETGERMVVYEGLYPPFEIYARPYAMFMSEVDHEKYPNAKQKYRFELF